MAWAHFLPAVGNNCISRIAKNHSWGSVFLDGVLIAGVTMPQLAE